MAIGAVLSHPSEKWRIVLVLRKLNRIVVAGAMCATFVLVGCGGGSSGNGDSTDNMGASSDTDGDGVPNSNDAFPDDPTESVDTDGDGIGNNADTDDDADGLPDSNDENPLDTDNDGLPNSEDTDDDDDGVLDTDDAFPLDQSESMDSDGDGIGDNADTTMDMTDESGSDGGMNVITSGRSTCIINTSADGNATFTGAWMWSNNTDTTNDLSVAYNIQDNTTACSGVGGSLAGIPSTSYDMSWQLPVANGTIVNILLNVDAANGTPVAVQNNTDTLLTLSSPDTEVGGAGSWSIEGCSLDISSVENSATPSIAIITGSLTCDANADPAQILTRPVPLTGVPNTTIRFSEPMTFRTIIALLG